MSNLLTHIAVTSVVFLGSRVITCTYCVLNFRLFGGEDALSFVYIA